MMKLLGLSIAVIFLFSAAAFSQTDVRVTNKRGDAVAVRSVDNPARHGYQVTFELNGPTPPEVPAGKVFAVEYISGQIRVPSLFGAAGPCKFLQLSFQLGNAAIDIVPISMGTAPGLSNDVNFITISQPVKAYIPASYNFGAANYSLSQYCSGPPTSSSIVVSGYLIND